jgi:mRNA interferase RelE/StbE
LGELVPSVNYRVTWSEKASDHFRPLDEPAEKRIAGIVNDIAGNPQPAGVKPVIGVPGVFRVRQGRYRALFAVDDVRRAIWIGDVRYRSRGERWPLPPHLFSGTDAGDKHAYCRWGRFGEARYAVGLIDWFHLLSRPCGLRRPARTAA